MTIDSDVLEFIAGLVAILAWPCAIGFCFWQVNKILDDVLGKS